MNLFATVLTYPAPSANYRGEREENRSVIQKVTQGRFEYAIISPEAMRNALREILAGYALPCNRERLDNEEQLAVEFKEFPFAEKFVDDFFFGYTMLRTEDRKKAKEVRGEEYKVKRDSILRMNLAKALEPYRYDSIFTQSPLNVDSPWKNAEQSALLHRETTVSAFQYPFAINLNDCNLSKKKYKEWLRHLLKAISELNGVAGNHARSYFEMAPASIIIRLSNSLVAGYDTYGFGPDGTYPEVIDGILNGDYPGEEFYIGGKIVRDMAGKTISDGKEKPVELLTAFKEKGVKHFRMAAQALDAVAQRSDVCGKGFLEKTN